MLPLLHHMYKWIIENQWGQRINKRNLQIFSNIFYDNNTWDSGLQKNEVENFGTMWIEFDLLLPNEEKSTTLTWWKRSIIFRSYSFSPWKILITCFWVFICYVLLASALGLKTGPLETLPIIVGSKESCNAISKKNGFLTRQCKYNPHIEKWTRFYNLSNCLNEYTVFPIFIFVFGQKKKLGISKALIAR